MSYEQLTSYATSAVAEILPLDQETCSEMIAYALSLPSDSDIESHFLNLLGEDEATFEFIANFMKLKREADSKKSKGTSDPSARDQKSKSSSGDKTIFSNQPRKSASPSNSAKNTNAWQPHPSDAKKETKNVKGRLENSKSATTSELLDLKPSNQQSNQQAKRSKKKNLDNLKDIESALNELEVKSQELDLDSSNYIKRVCNCMATRHPLFEVSPNCLNCGKIICSKEGLQPCSFCGQDLLSFKDKQEIINVLRAERDNLEVKQENIKNKSIQEQDSASKAKGKKIKISMNAGENLWQAQDKALKKADAEKRRLQELIEQKEKEQKEIDEQKREFQAYEQTKNVNPELLKAQERLETLLNFQETGAERTKIIDRASDYEMPSSNSGSAWLSPAERALRLKKQQKALRKYEDDVRNRSGRSKKVVEMVIKDGKVHMVEKTINTADNEDADQEMDALENEVRQTKLQSEVSLSKNTWDYEKEANKWEKPVYIPSGSRTSAPPDAMGLKSKARVQLFGTDDENELVVAMPS